MYIVSNDSGSIIIETNKLNEVVRKTIVYLLGNGYTVQNIKKYKKTIILTTNELIDKVNNSSIELHRKTDALSMIQNKQKITGIKHGDLRYQYLQDDLWARDGLGIKDITERFFNPISNDNIIQFLDTSKKVDLSEITKEEINRAILKYDDLKSQGKLNKKRENKKYTLFINSKAYPPKYIVSIAYGIKYNEETLSAEYLYATGKQNYSAQWCLENLGYELFEDETYKKYLTKIYDNEKTVATYYADLKKAIKILQNINELKEKSLTELFQYVLKDRLNFEEYDIAQKNIGFDDKMLFGTLKKNIELYKEALNKKSSLKTKEEEVMQRNKKEMISLNQILYGPPGTGKTYNTINKALEIIFEKEKDETIIKHTFQDNILENNIKNLKDILIKEFPSDKERKDLKTTFDYYKNQIEFVTFHQSYGYEEFVEGIKAQTIDGKIDYKVQPGVFKRISTLAEENYKGNQLKIRTLTFDELFDTRILTKFQDEGFVDIKTTRSSFKVFDITDRSIKFEKSTGNKDHSLSIDTLREYFNQERELKTNGLKGYYDGLIDILKENSIEKIDEQLKNYILIIDEVNRGNISKIFGELITLIERSKRIGEEEEIKVKLPNSKNIFGVPSNLYIIGTMNTADRSIAPIDTALRRRFEFIEMSPKSEKLNDDIKGINLQELLTAINTRIEYIYDRDHTIGHSYLLDIESLADLKLTFKNNILPLLAEYFYEDWKNIKIVLNEENIDGFIQFKKTNEYLPANGNGKVLYEFKDIDVLAESDFKRIYGE